MDDLKIIKDYLDGKKVVDIVADNKISSATVSKILKKYDIKTRYKSEDNSNNIYIEHTLLNLSFKDLSEKYKISTSEVETLYKKERNKRLIADYKKGININTLCQQYNLSNMGIYKILNKNNIERNKIRAQKRKFPVVSAEIKEKIIDDYYAGEQSVYALLDKYTISKHQLYSILYESGSNLRTGFTVSEETRQEIKNEYNKGITMESLSYKYKLSRPLISLIIRSD